MSCRHLALLQTKEALEVIVTPFTPFHQTKLAALMAGPVGPEFSKSAPKPQAPNTTVIVVNNTKAAVKPVEERAKVCTEMAKLSKLNAKECDVIIKDVKAAVVAAKEANPTKKVGTLSLHPLPIPAYPSATFLLT